MDSRVLQHPCGQIELATLLVCRLPTAQCSVLTAHLVDGVDSFHDPVLQKLEVAELHRIVHAVVLQVFIPKALLSVAGW